MADKLLQPFSLPQAQATAQDIQAQEPGQAQVTQSQPQVAQGQAQVAQGQAIQGTQTQAI